MIYIKKLLKKNEGWRLIEARQGNEILTADCLEIHCPVKMDIKNNAFCVMPTGCNKLTVIHYGGVLEIRDSKDITRKTL